MNAFQNNPFAQFMTDFQESIKSNVPNFDAGSNPFSGVSQQSIQNARKNYEATDKALEATMDLTQTLVRHYSGYARCVVDAFSDYVEQSANVKSPQESFEKQAKFAKEFSESAISNSKEVSEIISKSGGEVTEIVSSRLTAAMKEMSDIAGTAAEQATKTAANSTSAASKKKAA